MQPVPFPGVNGPGSRRNAVPIPIWFVISSFNAGGAEMTLCRLIGQMDRSRFSPQVITLVDIQRAPLTEKFRALDVPIRSLGMRPGRPSVGPLVRLTGWLRRDPPALVHTWMYHADLLGGLAAKMAGGIPVAWGIHHCNLSTKHNKWLTLQTVRACARLSRVLPATIVCSSEASRKVHADIGYAGDKMRVIHNGSDLEAFRPDHAARRLVRESADIPPEAPVVGLVGRFDPLKDHHNFVQAAAVLHRSRPDLYFLFCGEGITWENARLAQWIKEAGIEERCRLLGHREDIPRLMAAMDVMASSSIGESFALVIVEAMSCGVPCVVTDVGDSSLIVGQAGRVVPAQSPGALASACRDVIELGEERRRRLGMEARERVMKHFSCATMVTRYEALFDELAYTA